MKRSRPKKDSGLVAMMAKKNFDIMGKHLTDYSINEGLAMLNSISTQHKTVQIDGLDIFYREAGLKDAPTVLLLHGFPTPLWKGMSATQPPFGAKK